MGRETNIQPRNTTQEIAKRAYKQLIDDREILDAYMLTRKHSHYIVILYTCLVMLRWCLPGAFTSPRRTIPPHKQITELDIGLFVDVYLPGAIKPALLLDHFAESKVISREVHQL